MTHSGKIKTWNTDKGFGFVSSSSGGKDVFIHITDFVDRSQPPKAGQSVKFSLSQDSQGRLRGIKIQRQTDIASTKKTKARKTARLSKAPIHTAIVFLLATVGSAFLGFTPEVIPWVYFTLSFAAYAMYLIDKSAAVHKRWRTQESSLHLVALMGGWPGAALAQYTIRHKSTKPDFQRTFWLIVAINIAFYLWLHTEMGGQLLNQWLPTD